MKVSNKIGNPTQNAETAKLSKTSTEAIGEGKKASKTSAAFAGSSSAKVDLSQRAQDIKKAKELATPTDTINEDKVARLQKMIDEGKYKVDADAIADRLVDEHLLTPS